MLPFLKNHPFAVEAFFESSTVLTFAVPKVDIQNLIPQCLEVDSFDDKWGFIAVAMVQTKNLRPKGFPEITGQDFFLIGYRVFVRYTNNAGKRLRGLYIINSETDKRKMEIMGNIFTHYNYTTTDIHQRNDSSIMEISSKKSGFKVTIDSSDNGNTYLPVGSPFSNWKDARKFAGPLPFTFSFNAKAKQVLIIEGVRENWVPIPLKVLEYRFSFLDKMHLDGIILANAFIIRDVPYYWKKGKLEQWKA